MLLLQEKTGSIIERCVDKNGQNSITHYKVIDEINNLSIVHFTLETGRTHQIRVHSQYIGHPILRRYFIREFIRFNYKTSITCL